MQPRVVHVAEVELLLEGRIRHRARRTARRAEVRVGRWLAGAADGGQHHRDREGDQDRQRAVASAHFALRAGKAA